MRRTAHVVLTVVVVLLLPAGAAAFQGPWHAPAGSLSAVGQNSSDPQIAIAPDGTTTVVWYRSNGVNLIAQASTRAPGESFSAPTDLSADGQNAFDPQIAVGPDGTTTAIWTRGPNTIVQASTRAPGGSFSAPVDLSAAGQNADDPQLAVAPDGTTTVIWSRYNGSAYIVQASTKAPGGSYSAPVDLSAAGQNADNPQLAVAPDGTTTVVWRRYNGVNRIVQTSTRPPGGSFSPAQDLSLAGADANSPQVAVAPDGATTVVWTRFNGAADIVQASKRPAGGGFSEPIPLSLSAAGLSARFPQVAAEPDGRVTVIWARYNGANDIIQASTLASDGGFVQPVNLSAPGADGEDPQIAVAPDGATTAIWSRSNGANTIVQTSTRTPGGGFNSPLDLSAAGQNAGDQQIAVAPDGATAATWSRSNGSNGIVQAIFTANAPTVRAAPAITGAASVGAGLTCDGGLWTGASAITIEWLRGSAAVGAGATYTVDAADRGNAISCRVQATNPFGTAQSLSIAVGIAPAGSPASSPASPAPPAAPSPRSSARIRGKARVGRTLTCSGARFAGSTRISLRWLRSGKAIKRATSARYRVTRKDVGRILTCRATASGPGGTASTYSLGVIARR